MTTCIFGDQLQTGRGFRTGLRTTEAVVAALPGVRYCRTKRLDDIPLAAASPLNHLSGTSFKTAQ